jgi:catalase
MTAIVCFAIVSRGCGSWPRPTQRKAFMTKHKLLTALAALGVALPGTVRAEDPPVETQIVDALNKTFGAHAGYRANHAKGVVVEGSFKASPAAATLSRASLFDGSTIAVTVRFSDLTGVPTLPDGSDLANPHGMAIKYPLPDGSDTDMLINSLKFFPRIEWRGVPQPGLDPERREQLPI